MNIGLVLLILFVGLFGAFAHYLKVKQRCDVKSFVDYFFLNNVSGSVTASAMFFTAMQLAYSNGAFNGLEVTPILLALKSGQIYPPLIHSLIAAFTAGYACDSGLNSYIPSSEPKSTVAENATTEAVTAAPVKP